MENVHAGTSSQTVASLAIEDRNERCQVCKKQFVCGLNNVRGSCSFSNIISKTRISYSIYAMRHSTVDVDKRLTTTGTKNHAD